MLENLVNQRLLALDAQKMRLSVSDASLRDTIAAIPAFQGERALLAAAL